MKADKSYEEHMETLIERLGGDADVVSLYNNGTHTTEIVECYDFLKWHNRIDQDWINQVKGWKNKKIT